MKNNIEIDIYRAIDMAFHWFKKNNPKLESICDKEIMDQWYNCLLYTSPSPRDRQKSRMPSSA